METEKLRKQMESLWKATFGDSSKYVKLVFDTYFNPDLCAYSEKNGQLESFLVGVPYEFLPSEGTGLNGLYLCGLSTRKEYRRKGLMAMLLEEINEKASKKGFDFTFLIPSSEGRREYYSARGYYNTFYKLKENYVHGHRFKTTENIDVQAYDPETGSDELLEFLKGYKQEKILENHSYALHHSIRDWECVVREAVISEEPIFIGRKEGRIIGASFCCRQIEGKHKEIELKKILASSKESEVGLLKGIELLYPDANITVVRDLYELIANPPAGQLWSPFYLQNNGKTAEYEDVSVQEVPYDPFMNAYSFGMVRLGNVQNFLSKTGIARENRMDGYSDAEIISILLRKPSLKDNKEGLVSLLNLPEICLSASLLLE